jgi:hypothetical protein
LCIIATVYFEVPSLDVPSKLIIMTFMTIKLRLLGIHDLFGTELAMIFSFHVGLTDSLMQRMQFLFSVSVCSTFSCHRIARYYFNIRKKLNDLISAYK